jgi:hypothetical protein
MLMLGRRMLLRASTAAAGAAALAPTVPAAAHSPKAGKRAQPSFYRFKLGAIELTVVSDAIGPRTQEACSHPRSNRLGRWGCNSTPSSSTPATSWC